jgi:site-specific DNA recombinase
MRSIKRVEPSMPQIPVRKRVAAYARVSSGKDAMLHSLSAQVSYYSVYNQRRRGWEYVGVYADEALTGTKDERPEFQRLMNDCRDGKIDMVITKSIARFARNTVTMLEAVRELKSLGVDVYFEKENIHSLSGDGEVMLTILASYAQEESRSVSENCKWRVRKMFAQGRTNNGVMLGYRLIDGTFYIVPEEAEIVRMIFFDYLSGMGRNAIVKKLNALELETRRGGRWGESSVAKVLCNEKYTGDMLLQKTFVADHLTKKKCFNHGQLPQYYVSGSHEAIIDKDTFERVQQELKRRAEWYHPSKQTPTRYPFTSVIQCGLCGQHYRRKIANAGGKYAKPVWICPTFNTRGKAACSSKQIPEDILQAVSAEALGIPMFDSDIFAERITEIQVPENNRLLFIFRDGRRVEKTWRDKSRRDSWNDAMRQAARERQLEITERRNRE